MNSFFKTFFACLLALVVGGIFMFLTGLILLAGMISLLGSGERSYSVSPNTVLQIDLSMPLPERASASALDMFDYSDFSFREQTTLLEAVTMVGKAANDPDIDGIYLNVPMAVPSSTAALYELRQAIEEFRQSGKFVIAYADAYSQGGYYLASAADRVYLNPQGGMDWSGMSMNVLFYKGLFDKLGIRPELIRHGAFKSAGEPFIQDHMSPENREQLESMAFSMWDYLVGEVARSRNLDADSLQAYASRLAVVSPRHALEYKMIDGLYYRDQIRDELSRLTDREKPRIVGLSEYKRAGNTVLGNVMSSNRVAVLYADGDIVDGGDRNKQIVGNDLAAQLAKLRRDDKIKAVVLRVNSPGGSALASEVIWREVWLTTQQKPVVVSMGNYAASGGYYISCAADQIVTGPMTLTGSIGVFGLLFDVSQGMRDKLGITSETVRTNPSADLGSIFRPMTPAERLFIQNGVDSVYARFTHVVAQGRELPRDSVDALAGGRVWTGLQADRNGLADRIGTLTDAIQLAMQQAGITPDDFLVRVYPEAQTSSFTSILGALSSEVMARVAGRSVAASLGEELLQVKERVEQSGIRTEIPYRLEQNN